MFHHHCPHPLDRLPSATLQPYKKCDDSTLIIHHTHPAPISPPRAWNHLPIGAPLTAFVEHHRVVILATTSKWHDTIGENSDDLSLPLSELSQRRPEPWSGRDAPMSQVHHGPRASRGPVIHRPDL
jgi:hypothetical protein